jgi:hypothetical protein
VVDVVKEGNRVCGVVVENTTGRQTVLGKVIIECTGEGDVAARAGAPFEKVSKDDPYPLEPFQSRSRWTESTGTRCCAM